MYKGVADRKKALKVSQSVQLKCFSCFLVVFHDDHLKSADFLNNGSQIFWSKFLELVRRSERSEGIERSERSRQIVSLGVNCHAFHPIMPLYMFIVRFILVAYLWKRYNAFLNEVENDAVVPSKYVISNVYKILKVLNLSNDVCRVGYLIGNVELLKLFRCGRSNDGCKHVKLKEVGSVEFNDASRITFDILRCGDVESNPGPRAGAGAGRDQDQFQDLGERRDMEIDSSVNDGSSRDRKSPKSQLQVVTQNVRGLGESKKVRHLINCCYKLSKNAHDSIFMLQVVYIF